MRTEPARKRPSLEFLRNPLGQFAGFRHKLYTAAPGLIDLCPRVRGSGCRTSWAGMQSVKLGHTRFPERSEWGNDARFMLPAVVEAKVRQSFLDLFVLCSDGARLARADPHHPPQL